MILGLSSASGTTCICHSYVSILGFDPTHFINAYGQNPTTQGTHILTVSTTSPSHVLTMHSPLIWHASMTKSLHIPSTAYTMATVLPSTPPHSFIPFKSTLIYPVSSPIIGYDDYESFDLSKTHSFTCICYPHVSYTGNCPYRLIYPQRDLPTTQILVTCCMAAGVPGGRVN